MSERKGSRDKQEQAPRVQKTAFFSFQVTLVRTERKADLTPMRDRGSPLN